MDIRRMFWTNLSRSVHKLPLNSHAILYIEHNNRFPVAIFFYITHNILSIELVAPLL